MTKNNIWPVSISENGTTNQFEVFQKENMFEIRRNGKFLYEFEFEILNEGDIYHIKINLSEFKLFKNFKQVQHNFELIQVIKNDFLILKDKSINLARPINVYDLSLNKIFENGFDKYTCNNNTIYFIEYSVLNYTTFDASIKIPKNTRFDQAGKYFAYDSEKNTVKQTSKENINNLFFSDFVENENEKKNLATLIKQTHRSGYIRIHRISDLIADLKTLDHSSFEIKISNLVDSNIIKKASERAIQKKEERKENRTILIFAIFVIILIIALTS